MFFESWSELLDMGGYGFYVWLSYGLSLLAIVVLIVQSLSNVNNNVKPVYNK